MDSFHTVEVVLLACGCANRCGHCYACATHQVAHPIDTALAERLLDLLMPLFDRAQERYVDIYYDLFDHPDADGLVRLLHRRNLYAMWRTIATHGRGIARRAKYRDLLKEMKAMGSEDIQLAFHGQDETHDKFVCRRGSFRDLIEAGKAGLEAGFVPVFPLFITKRNVQQWPVLFDQLKREGLLARSEHSLGAGLISPYGYAEALEEDRVETADLLNLPESERKRVPCRPEAEWCHEALEGDHKLFALGGLTCLSLQVRGNREVFNSFSNPRARLGTLETDSLDAIIARYRESQSRGFRCSISDEIEQKGRSPRLVELARKHGQPNGQKLYRVASHAVKAWMLRGGKGLKVIQ
jgi:hypothetical protein